VNGQEVRSTKDNSRVGPFTYAIVMLLLFAYFAWILDRMAAFSAHGILRLDKLAVGLGIAVVALGIGVLAGLVHRRGRAG
jgi:hypothetical protein